ncbi:MAG: serine hydrolase [Cyclobacteriaceae bacterium]
MTETRIAQLLGLMFLCCSCTHSQSQDATNYFPDQDWRLSSAIEEGLNSDRINDFIEDLDKGQLQEPITSFLIVKNGYLVVDEYFDRYKGEEPHTLQSVTKSITSTLIALAIQNGKIESLDQKVLDFFPEYDQIDNLDENKQRMNLRNALMMQTGQAWTGERHLGPLNSFSGDKMKYVLDYKMEGPPGKKWYYNSGIAILLGGLVANATQMTTQDFADQYLFGPLDISSAEWGYSHRGIPHTGGGLYLNSQDMARIGYLYLRNGRWRDQQLLPSWWIEEMLERRIDYVKRLGDVKSGYGYMWWLLPFDKEQKISGDIYMAYGHWGQFIFVIPNHDMVVIFTNDNSASYPEELKPIDLLYRYVIPAIEE